jgi:ATP-dependent 26S proteasome regulatory subunit
MEIGLPNEQGRFQILNIHTSKMKEYKKINPDVDIKVRQNYFMLSESSTNYNHIILLM